MRSEWGLDKNKMTYRELSNYLSAAGYQCSVTDVKNAARPNAKLVENRVPRSAEVLEFLDTIANIFPMFESHRLIE